MGEASSTLYHLALVNDILKCVDDTTKLVTHSLKTMNHTFVIIEQTSLFSFEFITLPQFFLCFQ